MKTFSLFAGATGSLLLASSAQAVITGVTVVPVSFEQGWLSQNGTPYANTVTGPGTTTNGGPTFIPDPNDPVQHGRTAAAWAASLGAYKTFRVYITTSDLTTPVNGSAGDDVANIDFFVESRLKDNSGTGSGFFNYQTGAVTPLATGQATTAGPQPYGSATNVAQGQRAYDSYLTVGGADALGSGGKGGNAGAAIEGTPGFFNAVRGRTGVAGTVQTGAVGNGFSGALAINCQNCGFLATLPILPKTYTYTSAASLASNFGNPIVGTGVLVGQFTVKNTDGIMGQLLAVGTGTNASAMWTFAYQANVPAPGALALLGLAGIAARRRRS